MRYLKPGWYYVNIYSRVMRTCDHIEDYSDLVIDFDVFSKIGCDVDGDMIYLDIQNPNKRACFIHTIYHPLIDNSIVDFYDVFKKDEATPMFEDL